MNKNHLLIILATFSLGFGLIFCISPIFLNNWHAPATTTSLLFGISLLYNSISSYYYAIRTQFIIKKLRSSDSSIWARWRYNPQRIPFIYEKLTNERDTILSDIILVMVFGFLITVGFYFCNPIIGLQLALVLTGSLILCGTVLCFIISRYYKLKLNTFVEAIITSEYIFFLENIYQFSTKYYPLENILIDDASPYSLAFIYSFYGTSLPLAPVVTIPIPPDAMSLAIEIQQKYSLG